MVKSYKLIKFDLKLHYFVCFYKKKKKNNDTHVPFTMRRMLGHPENICEIHFSSVFI